MSRRGFLAKLCGLCLGALLLTAPGAALAQTAGDPENTLVLELKSGKVLIKLLPDLAPKHVERIKTLVREGFYDGVVWHRVMEGFMAQTGDPTGTGRGGSELPDLEAEFSNAAFERGIVGMARTSDPDSANSQWFVMFDRAPNLDRNYTIWGRVIEGMEHIDAIKKAPTGSRSGAVENPDKILSLKVLADLP